MRNTISSTSISIGIIATAIPTGTLAIFQSNRFGGTRGGVALNSNNGGFASGSFTSNNLGGSVGLPGGFSTGGFPNSGTFGQGSIIGSSGSGFGSFFNNNNNNPNTQQQTTTKPAETQQITKPTQDSSSNNNVNDGDGYDNNDADPGNEQITIPNDPDIDSSTITNIDTVQVPPIDVAIGASKGGSGTSFKDVGGSSVYVRKFAAYGFIDRACVNIDEFCNGVENGDPSAFISCYAARQAVSQIQGAYSFEGRLRVGAGRQGVINAIDLRTEANAAALALSFTDVGSSIQTQTTVDVGALSVSGSGLSNAEALAVSNSTAQAASVAYAASLGSSGSRSFTNTQVRVRGDHIHLFEGFVTSAAGSFAMSGADSEALASSAAQVYSDVLTVARMAAVANQESTQQGETFSAGIYQDADALSEAFGKAVSESVGAIGVTFTFGATISGGMDASDDDVEINFGGGTSASVACG